MNISLHIEAASPIELQEAITGLAGITGGTTTPQPETEKPKRTAKNSDKPANKPDVTSEVTTNSEPTDAEPEDKGSEDEYIPTVVELRAKAQEKGTTPEGKKAIKTLLDGFGSKSISDVSEEKRASFMGKLEAL